VVVGLTAFSAWMHLAVRLGAGVVASTAGYR
jgi:hypothetical protein